MSDIKVISLGGSIIAPKKVAAGFLRAFRRTLAAYLDQNEERRLILVCGGGGPARDYQRTLREIIPEAGHEAQDWIGIAATRLNAELLKHLFAENCPVQVVTDPTAVSVFPGRVLVAAGWKPGFSTDYVAVLLAEKFRADILINLSNIAGVFTADPRTNPDASPLDRISWPEFRNLVGDTWIPGKNVPFDPVATAYAANLHLKVIVAAGKDYKNLKKILAGSEFKGTVIGPD